jgi:hypothetical protein
MIKAFQMKKEDNVAVLLDRCKKGEAVSIIGDPSVSTIVSLEDIEMGHKIALSDIIERNDVVKFGVPIGYASEPIKTGKWIHLHNCASHFDVRDYLLDTQPCTELPQGAR